MLKNQESKYLVLNIGTCEVSFVHECKPDPAVTETRITETDTNDKVRVCLLTVNLDSPLHPLPPPKENKQTTNKQTNKRHQPIHQQ